MFNPFMRHPRAPSEYRFPSHRTSQSQPQSFQYNENQRLDYWCDTCDKGFGNQYLLDKHKSQHQICNIDGCKFVAHPKVITKHIQMQHSTGLYNRIAKTQDPEEIKKWREERRNKFPTKANIEKKNLVLKEKIDRGEKIDLVRRNNKYDPGNNRKSITNTPHNNRTHNLDRNKKKNTKHEKNKITKIISPIENKKRLKAFCGIQELLTDKEVDVEQKPLNFQIDDDDWIVEPNINNNEKRHVCNALLTIVSNYDSADEQESPMVVANNVNNTIASISLQETSDDVSNNKKENSKNMEASDDDSPPQEEKILKEGLININVKSPTKMPNKVLRKVHRCNLKHPHKVIKKQLPSTLLQKLLSKEIKHERNKILQCIRYIVKNKYFENK